MLALQERIQGEVPADHPAMQLVEHARELLTKYLVGHDGRTAFERLTGKPSRDDGYEWPRLRSRGRAKPRGVRTSRRPC
eukprot:6997982-Alexandrium_andersonii.AAC.1